MEETAAPDPIRKPYLLLIADQTDPTFAKTGQGLRDWCPQDCAGQLRFSEAALDLGLPDLDIPGAVAAGARTAVIAITHPGGALPPSWRGVLLDLLDAGLDLASGLHVPLEDVPGVAERAASRGRQLHNVRLSRGPHAIGTGRKRGGRRLLTVGTDCAVGKKYTALAIARDLARRGVASTFRATGQTGILIAGGGIAVDAVKADFVSGAAEALSPDAAPDHWDVVEGQGSLFHPSFAAVTLGLVHGTQPDLMVLCHRADRTAIAGIEGYAIPPLGEAIDLYSRTARLTNPKARVAAVSLNCAGLAPGPAETALASVRSETGLPAFDAMQGPIPEALLDALDAPRG